MATEFLVKLADRPGQLAALAGALGKGKVQLRGIGAQKGVVGLLVADKDAAKARRALKAGKFPYLCTVAGHAKLGMKGTVTAK